MIVCVDLDSDRIDLQDVDDLTRLTIELSREATLRELQHSLSPLGRPDSTTHALLSINALRAAAGRDHDPDWSTRFTSMVEYARAKGWVDGASLRVHSVVTK